MTEDEKSLAELAIKKVEAQELLDWCRSELRILASNVALPVCIPINGKSVHILPSQYHGGLPQCKVYRCAHE